MCSALEGCAFVVRPCEVLRWRLQEVAPLHLLMNPRAAMYAALPLILREHPRDRQASGSLAPSYALLEHVELAGAVGRLRAVFRRPYLRQHLGTLVSHAVGASEERTRENIAPCRVRVAVARAVDAKYNALLWRPRVGLE